MTDPQVFGRGDELRHERIVDAAFDEQTGTGDAGLAGRREDAEQDAGAGDVEIGVREYDGRRLAAKLKRHRHQFVGGLARQRAAGLGAARERDFLHRWMRHQPFADDRAGARQRGEQPARQARFIDDAREFERNQRAPGRRLEQDRVAGGECRRHFLRVGSDRRIPRRDAGGDAERLVHREGQVLTPRRGKRLLHGLERGRHIAEGAGRTHRQCKGFGQGLAGIARLHQRDALGIPRDAVGDPIKKGRALMRQQLAPGRIVGGLFGATDRKIDILGRSAG